MLSDYPRPEYKTVINASDGMNSDIIAAIHQALPKATSQVQELSKHFVESSRYMTAKNIWDFLKNNIRYVRDADELQKIKLPSRLLAEGTGDCKSLALFTAAILKALNMPAVFRYASYSPLNSIPSHVYTTTKDERGKEIIIDAVWHSFNEEKQYSSKKDYPMYVATLSGFEEGVGTILSSVWKGTKKVVLAPARNAFLALVAVNVHGFATKLKKALVIKSDAIQRKWETLGGNYMKLYNTAQSGAKKKAILGIEPQAQVINGSKPIGTVAAVLALAAPIIAALAPFLKSISAQANDPDIAITPDIEQAIKDAGGDYQEPQEDGSRFTLSPPLLIGGAALAAYFLLKD